MILIIKVFRNDISKTKYCKTAPNFYKNFINMLLKNIIAKNFDLLSIKFLKAIYNYKKIFHKKKILKIHFANIANFEK